MKFQITVRILTLLLIFLSSSISAYAWQSWKGKVINAADGDTITVLTSERKQIKVRLYGIDSPERRQAFGNRARQAMEKFSIGTTVEIQTMDTDRYGRTVGIVYLPSGDNLNELLVNDGFAWVYTKYCTKKFICDPLKKLEIAARVAKRGLWIDKNPVAPWEWRKQSR